MLATFDPMKVNVSFNNRQLRMFGESMFTLARDEANVTLKKGVKGDSTYILNANKAGKLTITLDMLCCRILLTWRTLSSAPRRT